MFSLLYKIEEKKRTPTLIQRQRETPRQFTLGLRQTVAPLSLLKRHLSPSMSPEALMILMQMRHQLHLTNKEHKIFSLSIYLILLFKISHNTQRSAWPCNMLMPFKWTISLSKSDNSNDKSGFIFSSLSLKDKTRTALQLPKVNRSFLKRKASSGTDLQSQNLWQLKILI